MPNYGANFNSANWEHEKKKHSRSKRRFKSKVKFARKMELARVSGAPLRIVDEVPVYEVYKTKIIPAYVEKEKSFYIIKNGRYWYTDRNGVDHYLDDYVWKETGKEIYHPEKVIRLRRVVENKPVGPYIINWGLSGRRGYAKEMTHRLARRRFDNLESRLIEGDLPDDVNISKNSDHKCFDYAHSVW